MRQPDEIIHNGRKLSDILADHEEWLRGEGGGKQADLSEADLRDANLSGANLSGADLRVANLSDADLSGANLRYADLRGVNLRVANLRGADLRVANLRYADLSGANLRYANLIWSNLSGANLRDANLSGADLSEADLSEADLRCIGNMVQIKTLLINKWHIGYTHDTLQIGYQRHPIEKWQKWNTEAGRKWVSMMDDCALEWADKHLDLVLQIIATSPAEK